MPRGNLPILNRLRARKCSVCNVKEESLRPIWGSNHNFSAFGTHFIYQALFMSVHLIIEYTDHPTQYDVQERTAIRVTGYQIYQFIYLNKHFSPSVYPGYGKSRRVTGQSSFLKQESMPSCNYFNISQKVEFDVQSVLMPTFLHILYANIYFSSQHFGRL